MRKSIFILLQLLALVAITSADVQECYSELVSIYHHPEKHLPQFAVSGKGYSDFGDPHLCQMLPDTRYILANLKFKDNTYINGFLGICGPQNCSPDDFAELSIIGKQFVSNQTNQSLDKFELTFYDPDVENKKLRDFGVGTWVMIVILIILCILGLLGSLIDYNDSSKDSINANKHIELANYSAVERDGSHPEGQDRVDALNPPVEKSTNPLLEQRAERTPRWRAVLKCFSFSSNISKIFSFERKETRTNIFNGIRVISLTLILFGHAQYYHARAPAVNVYEILAWTQNFWFQIVLAAPFLVDNFLLIGGFLAIYGRVDEAKSRGRVSVFASYVHRIFRILPLYAMIVFYFWKIQPIFTDGVAGFFYKKMMDLECADTWWTNILFVNNQLPKGNVASCMGYTWYLAIDMQMFLVTPILFNLYLKKKLYGWLATGFLTLISVAYAFFITYVKGLTPIVIEQFLQTAQYYEYYYVQPLPRFAPYGIGILLAFMYMEFQDYNMTRFTRFFVEKYKSRCFRRVSYILGVLIMLFLVFIQYPLNTAVFKVQQVYKSSFLAFGRLLWPIMLAMFLIPMLFGHGKHLYNFLAGKFWTPFTRLSFGAFLLHPAIMLWFYWNSNQGSFVQLLRSFEESFGYWVLSMFAACIMSILSESPGMNLEKMLTGRAKKEVSVTVSAGTGATA